MDRPFSHDAGSRQIRNPLEHGVDIFISGVDLISTGDLAELETFFKQ
jgi:hypothetical protein